MAVNTNRPITKHDAQATCSDSKLSNSPFVRGIICGQILQIIDVGLFCLLPHGGRGVLGMVLRDVTTLLVLVGLYGLHCYQNGVPVPSSRQNFLSIDTGKNQLLAYLNGCLVCHVVSLVLFSHLRVVILNVALVVSAVAVPVNAMATTRWQQNSESDESPTDSRISSGGPPGDLSRPLLV
ncbi:expressed unknown protein [Seminavis robusta]|uniref:Uncharacterized protein n=1 Tax=Seminavis robusta TaxID=568900 RepID=A0A9N8EKV9_9STRA|nr:expressed unknown protein [Seminavis robusta]|eukprot:Sro1278_g258761.1  (180) ;mRNA; f:9759-10298